MTLIYVVLGFLYFVYMIPVLMFIEDDFDKYTTKIQRIVVVIGIILYPISGIIIILGAIIWGIIAAIKYILKGK